MKRTPVSVAEQTFEAMAKKRKWKLTRSGWPDYIVETTSGTIRLVEVKLHDHLSGSQLRMYEMLERTGLHVEVWSAVTKRFVPWKKYRARFPQRKQPRIFFKDRKEEFGPGSARPFDPVLGV